MNEAVKLKYRYFNKKLEDNHPRPTLDSVMDDCVLKDTIKERIATTTFDGSTAVRSSPKRKSSRISEMEQSTFLPNSLFNPYGDKNNKDNTDYCQSCYCLNEECLNVMYGPELFYYFRKVSLDGNLDLEKNDSDDNSMVGEDIISIDYAIVLNELMFATSVMNGIDLEDHKVDGLVDRELLRTKPLPKCIIDGSYKLYIDWINESKICTEWGLDIDYESNEVSKEIVNFFRPFDDTYGL